MYIEHKLYKEVIADDEYHLRRWNKNSFKYIIDIGANIGAFSLVARILFPTATIISVEPFTENFNNLVNNVGKLPNIHLINQPYGKVGSRLVFEKKNNNNPGCVTFIDSLKENDGIECISLEKIFKDYNIPKDSEYLIKMDCEGGERYLLESQEDTDLIVNSKQFNVEIHFPSLTGKNTQFKNLPAYINYVNWIKKNFTSHTYNYYRSRKANGHGLYLVNKNDRK